MISFNPHNNFIFHWGGWYSKWFCTACIRCNWVRAHVFCLKSGFFRCKDMLWLFLAQFFILAYKQAPQRYWSTFLYQCKILNLTHFLSDKKQSINTPFQQIKILLCHDWILLLASPSSNVLSHFWRFPEVSSQKLSDLSLQRGYTLYVLYFHIK